MYAMHCNAVKEVPELYSLLMRAGNQDYTTMGWSKTSDKLSVTLFSAVAN
jgi:hypothetical protein